MEAGGKMGHIVKDFFTGTAVVVLGMVLSLVAFIILFIFAFFIKVLSLFFIDRVSWTFIGA